MRIDSRMIDAVIDSNQRVREVKVNNKIIPTPCSFCGKVDVKKIIAGPNVYICEGCVELCVDIIREEVNPNFCKDTLERYEKVETSY